MPVSEQQNADSVVNNANIDRFNEMIKQVVKKKRFIMWCREKRVSVNGFLPSEASTDGIHLNKEYCVKVAGLSAVSIQYSNTAKETRKMKKLAIAAVALFVVCLFGACSSSEPKDVDVAKLAEDLHTQITYQDDLGQISD